jgi:hypothetical protein
MISASLEAWLQEETAKSPEEIENGDGRHPDEVQALRSFLNDDITASEAARALTLPLTLEADPRSQLYRIWGLLADAIVEHGQEVGQKLVDVLAAVQKLPKTVTASTEIDWSQLPGFGHMWFDCHSLHFHGPNPWESGREGTLTEERVKSLCQLYEDLGKMEALIWLRVPNAINPDLGYEVLNLSRSGRAGLYVIIYQIRAWLKVAGRELWKHKAPDEIRQYSGSARAKRMDAPMAEHWAAWEEALVELSGLDGPLPEESRKVAVDCLELMRYVTKE